MAIRSFLFRITRAALISAAAALVLCGTENLFSDSSTQQPLSARDLHVWGRFGVGTWKRVKIITETLNGKGQVVDTTTTETKTTLVRADAHRLSLKIDVTVNVAGKRFEGQSQMIECGYYGESLNEPSDVRSIGSTQLTIDGRRIPCQIRQVTLSTGNQRQIVRLFLSDDIEPYVLKRETALVRDDNAAPATTNPETTAEVISLDMPYSVLRGVKPASFERTIQRTAKGTNISLDVTCVDVPGAIVARATKELDERGTVTRRSMLELIDYQVVSDDDNDDSRVMTRREARRARRR
jgi:hypothetical protein